MSFRAALAAATFAVAAMPAGAATFVNALAVAGDRTDLSSLPGGANGDRLGGFGSDLVRAGNLFYGLVDRGPGGGVFDYQPRIQVFTLDQTGGATTGLTLSKTVVLTQADGSAFTGKAPTTRGTLGNSIDAEGLAIDAAGNFFVSDEYAPAVRKFDATGKLVQTFAVPANLVPRRGDGSIDYTGDRANLATGRQDNRGFEGLTLSNDGTKLYAALQDPLFQEGRGGQGRRGSFVRIVEYDATTGVELRQLAYQLEAFADVNTRLPAGQQFGENNQGRSIGISSISTLPNGQLLVLERDNRGLGTDDDYLTGGLRAIGSKRVYTIDLASATDIKSITLTGGVLPTGVRTVAKSSSPWLDIVAAIGGNATIVEKLEGMAFGDVTADGGRDFYVMSDNDFSVTQDASSVQSDICFDASGQNFTRVPLNGTCPTGQALLPTYVYTFHLSQGEAAALGFAGAVPEPASWMLMIAGMGLTGAAMRRRPTPARG